MLFAHFVSVSSAAHFLAPLTETCPLPPLARHTRSAGTDTLINTHAHISNVAQDEGARIWRESEAAPGGKAPKFVLLPPGTKFISFTSAEKVSVGD